MSICQHTIDIHKYYEEIADQAIVLHNSGEAWKGIAQKFNVDKDSLVNYLAVTGRYKKKNNGSKPVYSMFFLQSAFDMYKEGKSISEIARQLGVNRKTLSKYLKNTFKLKIRQDGKKSVDDYYFNNIDTAEKAYWLGFLYADGCVSKNNKIEFGLQDADKDNVFYFKNAIKSAHAISKKIVFNNDKKFVNWRISFTSKIMASDLKRNGCIPQKTYSIQFPTDLSQELMYHFIRGYTDGDGCICVSDNKLFVTYTSASLSFLEKFQYFLYKENITSYIYKVTNKDNWRLDVTALNAKKLCQLIYNNSSYKTRLKRKYDKYINFLQLPSIDEDCISSIEYENGIKLEGLFAKAKANQRPKVLH